MRFELNSATPINDAVLTLVLARLSAEGLVGAARVRLDVRHDVDHAANAIVVRGSGEAFESITRIFTSLLAREFGEDAFVARTLDRSAPEPTAA